MLKIAIVEDDNEISSQIADFIENELNETQSVETYIFNSIDQYTEHIESEIDFKFDVIFMDYNLGDTKDGVEFASELSVAGYDGTFVFVTGEDPQLIVKKLEMNQLLNIKVIQKTHTYLDEIEEYLLKVVNTKYNADSFGIFK